MNEARRMTCPPNIDRLTTAELLALVRSTDDNAHLWDVCQRVVWAEIARRGGV